MAFDLPRVHAGVDARERPFPSNRWYFNAITAAVDLPDLAGFLNSSDDNEISSMGSNHVRTGHWQLLLLPCRHSLIYLQCSDKNVLSGFQKRRYVHGSGVLPHWLIQI